jgi:exodeoxyribonuclease VII large subunit
VVTSPNAAAFQDILKVLSRRYPLAEVVLSPTLVQGSEAPPQIAAAIKLINMLEGVDVVIVARGGGSIEDLWAFNDERVARAIFASRYPVVTGVGHETDTTIVDFVADVRAPTPSAAAEIVTPNIAEFRAALLEAVERLHDTVHVALDDKRMELNDVTRRLHLASPAVKIPAQNQQVAALRERCALHLNHALRLHKAELGALSSRLKVLNPQQIMERGYAIVTRAADGTPVSSTQQVRAGEDLQVRLKDGTFGVRAE